MKRKIFILTLLGVFFTSTAGMPFYMQVCSMYGLNSTNQCKMHKSLREDHSCCKNEDENPVKITLKAFDGCCQIKVFNKNITDQFLSSANDVNLKSNLKVTLPVINVLYQPPVFSVQNYYTSSSPPPLLNNHIYLNNSILLI